MRPGCFSIVMALCVLVLTFGLLAIDAQGDTTPTTKPATALAFVVKDIDGKDVDLSTYKGKVVLIVNVASKCGFTKQYAGLEKLYEEHEDAGLVVIGFPANNFNGQEPGSEDQIKSFCSTTYGVTFPMMSKISVKGDDKAPLYRYLTEPATAGEFAGEIGWNFNKFLIDKDGKIAARFPSDVTPGDPKLIEAITAALAK
jgi:glutathione peroxidase